MRQVSSFHVTVLLLAGLLTAGCASREASPSRVDEDALAEELWTDLAKAGSPAAAHDLLAREIVAFAALSDRLEAGRADLLQSALRAQAATADGRPIPGVEVEALNRTFAGLLAVVHETASVAARHAAWRGADVAASAAHHAPQLPDELRREGAALSATASLALYDAYLLTGTLITGDPAVRHVLNRGDSGLGVASEQLDGLSRDYLSLIRRGRVHDCLSYLEAAGAAWSGCDEVHAVWLRERIAASPSHSTLTGTWLVPLNQFGGEVGGLIESDLRRLGDRAIGGASKGFGNAVGSVAFRKGRLFGNAEVEARLRAELRPGDILLEKTPFRLTDRFIPGHWGHAAIWVGTEQDLRALGVWEDPLVQRQAAAIREGRGVTEALRDGVQLNTLAHFLDIDDLCVLRQPTLPAPELAEHLRRALRQLGKEYDFNFDVETADRIVCSELVYQVYTGISWPTSRALGRFTISPDHVAERALAGGPLQTVDLWHDGQRIDGDLGTALAQLLAP